MRPIAGACYTKSCLAANPPTPLGCAHYGVQGEHTAEYMRWGLVSFWAKDVRFDKINQWPIKKVELTSTRIVTVWCACPDTSGLGLGFLFGPELDIDFTLLYYPSICVGIWLFRYSVA